MQTRQSKVSKLNLTELSKTKGFDLNDFLENNKAFIMKLAYKYHSMYGVDIDDLFQEGAIGATRAYAKFKPELNIKFTTYAHWWIEQGIRECCYKNVALVTIPKTVQRHNWQEMKEQEAARQGNPVQEALSAPAKEHESFATRAAKRFSPDVDKLKNMVRIEDDENFIEPQYDEDYDKEDPQNFTPLSDKMRESLKKAMSATEYFIVNLRLGLERPQTYSLEKIGEIMGCTREWVRVMEKVAIDKLREFYIDEDLVDEYTLDAYERANGLI